MAKRQKYFQVVIVLCSEEFPLRPAKFELVDPKTKRRCSFLPFTLLFSSSLFVSSSCLFLPLVPAHRSSLFELFLCPPIPILLLFGVLKLYYVVWGSLSCMLAHIVVVGVVVIYHICARPVFRRTFIIICACMYVTNMAYEWYLVQIRHIPPCCATYIHRR